MNSVLAMFLMVMLMSIVTFAFEQGFEIELDNQHDEYASLIEASKGTYSPDLRVRVEEVVKAHDQAMGFVDPAKPVSVASPVGKLAAKARQEKLDKILKDIDMDMRLAPNTKRTVINEGDRLVREFGDYVSQFEKKNGSNCPKCAKEKEKEQKEKKDKKKAIVKKDKKAAKAAKKAKAAGKPAPGAQKKAAGAQKKADAKKGGKKGSKKTASKKGSKKTAAKKSNKGSKKTAAKKSNKGSKKTAKKAAKKSGKKSSKGSKGKKSGSKGQKRGSFYEFKVTVKDAPPPKPDVITKTVYKTKFVKLPCTKGKCTRYAPPAPATPPFFPPPFPPEQPTVV